MTLWTAVISALAAVLGAIAGSAGQVWVARSAAEREEARLMRAANQSRAERKGAEIVAAVTELGDALVELRGVVLSVQYPDVVPEDERVSINVRYGAASRRYHRGEMQARAVARSEELMTSIGEVAELADAIHASSTTTPRVPVPFVDTALVAELLIRAGREADRLWDEATTE